MKAETTRASAFLFWMFVLQDACNLVYGVRYKCREVKQERRYNNRNKEVLFDTTGLFMQF